MSEAISPPAHDDSLLPPLSAENNHTLGTEGLLMLSQSRKIHPENPCKWRKEKTDFVFCFPPLPPLFPRTMWAKQRLPVVLLLEEAHGEFGTAPQFPQLPCGYCWMCAQVPAKVNGFCLSQGRKMFSRSGRKLFSRSIRKQHIIPRTGSYIYCNTGFPMSTWTKHSGASLQPQGTWEATFLQLQKDPGPQGCLGAEHEKGLQRIPFYFPLLKLRVAVAFSAVLSQMDALPVTGALQHLSRLQRDKPL